MADRSLKQEKKDLVKIAILDVAERDFTHGGVTSVSIRKIASELGYAPSNIYKYYASKDAIIDAIIERRMRELNAIIRAIDTAGLSVIEQLKKGFKAHFSYVLTIPEHYKSVMLSQDAQTLHKTAMLDASRIGRLPAQQRLIDTITAGVKNGELKAINPILTAQVLWSSMFGLLIRIITEKMTDENQIEALINHYFDLVFEGLKA